LHLDGELPHLGAFLLIGRRDVQRQQVARRADGRVQFATVALVVAAEAGARSTLRRRLQGLDAAQDGARLGDHVRARRGAVRRSPTLGSKQPAVSHRRVCG
jgi:hypothetical protein